LTLGDFLIGRAKTLEETIIKTGVNKLGLIAGSNSIYRAANPKHFQKEKAIKNLRKINSDFALIDLGSGTNLTTLDFFVTSDTGLLITTAEATSIENTYRFIKSAFVRCIERFILSSGEKEILIEAFKKASSKGFRKPMFLINEIEIVSPELGDRIRELISRLKIGIIVNSVREKIDVDIGFQMKYAIKEYLKLNVEYLGALPYDDIIWKTMRTRQPIFTLQTDSLFIKKAAEICQKIIDIINLDKYEGKRELLQHTIC